MQSAMQSFQARLDSFQKTKRVKRNPGKQSSTTTSVKWPHPSDFKANANTLAEAGFYFNPSWEDRDSVACFLCGKELSDWDADDDPFEIHYSKCRNSCAWAVVRCGLTNDIDDEGRFVFSNKARIPSSKAMEKARLETFGEDWWPHDDIPGHRATSLKMAEAGFVYTPQAAGDDTVTCLYCNLSLGGWEKEDDPIQEHHKRDSKSGDACPFLSSTTKPVPVADAPPPRAKRGQARSTSTTIPPKTRKKGRPTRAKSVKPSASTLRRSQSPSHAVSTEADIPMDVDDPLVSESSLHPIVEQPTLPPSAVETRRSKSPTLVNDSKVPSPAQRPPSLPDVLSKPDPSSHILTTMPHHLTPPISPAGQPVIVRSHLTPQEREMSLEQWIRQEIGLSYEKLSSDGRRQIELFKEKAAELRRCIDEL